jgi:ASC-1-like (ASCH) protein
MSLVIDCSEPWYTLIKQKKKPVEGRKGTQTWASIKIGDVVIFRDPENKEKTFKADVTGVNIYVGPDALDQYLKVETLERALPGIKTLEEGRAIYLKWSKVKEIEKYGMLGIQVVPLVDLG